MNKTNKTNKTNDNIFFFFKEKVNDKKEANDSEIQKMMEEFTKNELMEDFEQDYEQDFEKDYNPRSSKFYRLANEVPTLLLIVIVILAILKPF